MRVPAILAALGGGLLAVAAQAQTPVNTAFDGVWQIVMTCPPMNDDDDDGAKGYVRRFSIAVKGGLVHGSYGTEGEPSYMLLTGAIPPDGKANLKLDGIVSRPDHAINNAWRGKPYTYRVRAQFEGGRGTGLRAGRRKCEFVFNKD